MYEWACVKSACNSGQCTSGAVALQAGQPLLLAVKHWNGQSIGSWQVINDAVCGALLFQWQAVNTCRRACDLASYTGDM